MAYHKLFFLNNPVKCLVLIIIFISTTNEAELCGSLNGKTMYLQFGEHGNITHNFEITNNYGNHSACGVELVTCPSCVIRISIGDFNREDCKNINDEYNRCPWNFISVWESSGLMTNLWKLCNSTSDYVTLTRSLRILMQFYNNQTSFTLHFTIERNRKILNGTIGDIGQFNSPFFPIYYPQDIALEHIFSCKQEYCKIILEFTDFLLAAPTIIEFFDWDGQLINVFSGVTFRPPIIQSSGPSLLIKLFGNGGSSNGYSGSYVFVNSSDDTIISNTECGGEVADNGGVIIMTNVDGYFNCYWIIKPINVIHTLKTHIYLKTISFSANGILKIKSGVMSNSTTLESIDSKELSRQNFKEHVIGINIGFYVSMKGKMGPSNKIIIAYSVFNYMDCIIGSDMMCKNKRCISLQLSCNGFDNCGDNSDELADCNIDTIPEIYQRFYFPKAAEYSDLFAATQAFIVSCTLLLVTVFGLMIALCRIGINTRNNIEFTTRVSTISHLLDTNQVEFSDDPPVYEPPPEYNQIIEPFRPRRKQSKQRILKKSATQSHKNKRLPENNSVSVHHINKTNNKENI